MSVALGLFLVAQLNSFEFTEIPSPQYVGDSFNITIVAKDPYGAIYPYNGSALLSTTRDDYWTYVYPSLITFSNGVWQDKVIVTLAESLKLRCVEPTHLITGQSNTINIFPGPPEKLFPLMPGEKMAPGSPEGRLPTPPRNQVAGDSFNFEVYLTDAWYNLIQFRNDSVYFSVTDSFAQLPGGSELSNGRGTFTVTLRQAGQHRLTVVPGEGSSIQAGTSSVVTVVPGSFQHLLPLFPGETLLPGDPTTNVWQTPGKAGKPLTQYVRTPFNVTVYPCDACWNRVVNQGDSVMLNSDFSFESAPDRAELADGAVFSVQFNDAGPNQNIWATTLHSGLVSYLNWLNIRALATQLVISAPDTVRAGETTYIQVTMKDANFQPIVAAPCRFAVITGMGEMLDSALLSDTLGRLTARFLCTADHGAENDTIKICADTTEYIGIYIDMPDSSLAMGKIHAFPNPFGYNRESVEISYYLQPSSDITVRIYDPFGNAVRSWYFPRNRPGARSGLNRLYWNGRNDQGRRVANGMYVVQVIGQLHTATTFKNTHRIAVVW
mgnify:CR=1 FL=1